jgi:hypothetical protein
VLTFSCWYIHCFIGTISPNVLFLTVGSPSAPDRAARGTLARAHFLAQNGLRALLVQQPHEEPTAHITRIHLKPIRTCSQWCAEEYMKSTEMYWLKEILIPASSGPYEKSLRLKNGPRRRLWCIAVPVVEQFLILRSFFNFKFHRLLLEICREHGKFLLLAHVVCAYRYRYRSNNTVVLLLFVFKNLIISIR